MYLLLLTHVKGNLDYVGPFPTQARATVYAAAAVEQYGDKLAGWEVKPLIVPYAVVRTINYREEDNGE